MKTAHVWYEGELRTRARHERSGEEILNDAPPDNHGRGEAFSPTDTMATSLLTCMFTVMGIVAERHAFQMGKLEGSVEKIMADNPRRIATLNIQMQFSQHNLSQGQKQILENTAINCPVALSLHPDIQTNTKFVYE